MPDKEFFDTWQFVVVLICFLGACIYGMVLLGAETPKQVRKRKQKEAEEFAAMTPEQQQLHLHAQNKVAEFIASLIIFIITCIFYGAIIYYVNWVM